jgi:hydrogenase maturation protease
VTRRALVLGYGNPGRRDDGLGPACALAIAGRELPGVVAETRYQLQIEDAARVADFETVVFVDADRAGPEPFRLSRIRPRAGFAFTTHSLAPEAVLALAEAHFGCRAAAYLLAIRGEDFDGFGEVLSPPAVDNLRRAAEHLADLLRATEPGETETSPTS